MKGMDMNTIRILNKSGDSPYQYDPETELDVAREKFHQLQSNGFTLFGVDPETKETVQIDQLFKENVQVVAVPQISGG
jgi:hypothetical protein